MSLSISDLFTAPTSDQIRANMVVNLISLGIPADKWRKGGVASSILTVASMSIALMASIVATVIQGFFLPTATGPSLKLLAQYVYGVTPASATFATGNLTLTNGGGGSYSINAGQYQAQNPTTKVIYTNTASFTLAPSGTATVPVVANVAGSAGNAAPGAISVQVTALLGVTVTNAAALTGVDAPSDADIRTLCINKLGALSVRGVRTAYAYAIQTALNSVTNNPVNINRWNIASSSHTGVVTVIVASPSGVPDANDVTGVANNIEAIARPEAVTVNVGAAVALPYTASLLIYCKLPPGFSPTDAKTAVDNELIAFFRTYPIGGALFTDDINPFLFQGLSVSAIHGAIAQALAGVGGEFIACQGGTDLLMGGTNVATDSITTTLRVIANTSGTTVL